MKAILIFALVCTCVGASPIQDNEIFSTLLEQIQSDAPLRKWMLDIRREIHQKPEVKYEEFETSKLIQRELQDMGIEYTSGIGVTGVIAKIGSGEPVIALRSDIDALPIEEETDLPFKSKNEGKMHACGHDVHTTMLLAAGKVIKDLDSKNKLGKGTVKLVFQPAEEGGAGALHMREYLQDISAIYGMHVWPALKTGIIGTKSGTIMASAAFFQVTFKGIGTHGAMSHLGVDPVIAASSAIQALQTLVSRKSSPLDSSVVSVTIFNAGSAYNVIPDSAFIGGTMRALTEESMNLLKEQATLVLRNIGEAYSCEVSISFMEDEHPITPPVVNDHSSYEFAKEVGQALVGKDNYVDVETTMGAEDFSYYTQRVKGAFVFLGIGNDSLGSTYPLHNPKFMADEEVLPIGAAYHTALAIASLKGDTLKKEL